MTNQAESKRSEIISGAVLTSALLKGAEIWMNAQPRWQIGRGAGTRRSTLGRGLSKRCVSAETPSISFRPYKIGYATPFGWPLSTSARWLAIPRF
jgi:hypothetical protein